MFLHFQCFCRTLGHLWCFREVEDTEAGEDVAHHQGDTGAVEDSVAGGVGTFMEGVAETPVEAADTIADHPLDPCGPRLETAGVAPRRRMDQYTISGGILKSMN